MVMERGKHSVHLLYHLDQNNLLVLNLTCEELGSCHCHPYSRENVEQTEDQ